MDARTLRVDAPQELLPGDLQLSDRFHRRSLPADEVHRQPITACQRRELSDPALRMKRRPVARFEHKNLWLKVRNEDLDRVLIQVVRFKAEVHRQRTRLAPPNATVDERPLFPIRDLVSRRREDHPNCVVRKNMLNERFLHDALLYEQRLRCTRL